MRTAGRTDAPAAGRPATGGSARAPVGVAAIASSAGAHPPPTSGRLVAARCNARVLDWDSTNCTYSKGSYCCARIYK